MKVLLVNPPYNHIIYPTSWRQTACEPPLGLAYLASYSANKGFFVDILDANAHRYQLDEVMNKLASCKADLIGFTATTITMPIVSQIIIGLRNFNYRGIIVVGGPHVSFVPEQTLNSNNGIDYIVIGEGEQTFVELTEAIKRGVGLDNIKGIAYRKDGRVCINEARSLISKVDTIPFPSRNLLPLDKYYPALLFNIGHRGKKYATMITSRGCPSQCTYCSSRAFWNIFRRRSADNIIEEIELLITEWDVEHLYFIDDTFTADKERLHAICNYIITKGKKVMWNCFAKVNSINNEMLVQMKKAGCFCITYGIESGDANILKLAKKRIPLDDIRRVIALTKKNDIVANCSFMLGLPNETADSMERTVQFAIELNPHIAMFYYTTPFPGTELFNTAINQQWLQKNIEWEAFSLHKGYLMTQPGLSVESVNKKVQDAFKRFYFRGSYLMQALSLAFNNRVFLKMYFRGALLLLRQIIANIYEAKWFLRKSSLTMMK